MPQQQPPPQGQVYSQQSTANPPNPKRNNKGKGSHNYPSENDQGNQGTPPNASKGDQPTPQPSNREDNPSEINLFM